MFTIKQVSKSLKIYPRSKTSLTAWQIADIYRDFIDRQLVTAADGIKWSIGTGRINGTMAMDIRAMSPYQTLKLLVEVANNIEVMGDVPRFLNRR